MKTKINRETGTKIAKLILIVAAVYLGMKFLFPMILPFLIALAVARFLYPLACALEKKIRLNRTSARFAAFGIFLVGIGILVVCFIYGCYRMGAGCLNHLDEWMDKANQIFCDCCDGLERMSGISTDEIQRTISIEAGSLTGGAVEYSKEAWWYLARILAKVFVTFIAAFLVLADYEKIVGAIKKTWVGRRAVDMLREVKTASGAYLKAQFIIMGTVTAVCIIGLYFLKIRYAGWIGLGIGFCDALPFIGTGTIFVPWSIIELLLGGYKKAAVFFVLYALCSLIRQMMEPRLVGKRLGVPPLAVLMSIYIGVQLYGGAGIVYGPLSALIVYELYREICVDAGLSQRQQETP